MHGNMRGHSALFLLLAVVLASLVARGDGSAALRGHEAQSVQGLQGHGLQMAHASPVIAKAGAKLGCRRGLPSAAPTPCGGGHALVTPVSAGWADTTGTAEPQTIIGRLKPYRPKGLLDPPRSA